MDKTQRGGFLGMGSPEYKTIRQALDVLATVKNKYVYKLFLAWANEKGFGLFEKVSDARSKLERLEKFIDEVNNKKIIGDDKIIITLDMLNMKHKYLIRIILCMTYVYCKKSNIEEKNINTFSDSIKGLLATSNTTTMSKRELNAKIIDSIKTNLLIGIPPTNLTNYKMVIINLYQKLLKIKLETTKFEIASAEAQKNLFEEEKQMEARLAIAQQGLPKTTNNTQFRKQLDEIQTLYRKIITDFNKSNTQLTELYTTIGFDKTKSIDSNNPSTKPDQTQINQLFDIIKILSAILIDCNQLITTVNEVNTSASTKKEQFVNLLKSIGFNNLTELTAYISDETNGLINKIIVELANANKLTRPILTGGYRTKKHSPSPNKHSSQKHNNNQKHKNKTNSKTKINNRKRTRKH